MNSEPIIVQRTFDAPIRRVWNAITNLEEMKQWFIKPAEFKPELGFEFHFYEGDDPDDLYLHKCKVTEVIEGRKIAYTWRYEGHDGSSILCFELFAEGDKTKLRSTHSGVETFKGPELSKENHAKGWEYLINNALRKHLENEDRMQ